jgi:hypothetical protein
LSRKQAKEIRRKVDKTLSQQQATLLSREQAADAKSDLSEFTLEPETG